MIADPYAKLAQAKAAGEKLKTKIRELEHARRMGEKLDRVDIETGAARTHLHVAQALRCLPDDLERQFRLPMEKITAFQDWIDALTTRIKARLDALDETTIIKAKDK